MLRAQNKEIQDWVIQAVLEADLHTAAKIQDYIEKKDEPVAIQTVYYAINKLIEGGVVVKHKTNIQISREWQKDVVSMVSPTPPDPTLNDGDRITYTFTSLVQLDIFWKHKLLSIIEDTGEFPAFNYVPHDLWMHLDGRESSQESFWNNFSHQKRYAFRLIGARTSFDKKLKQQATTKFVRMDISDQANLPRNEHITVIKDYITRTIYTKELAQDIDSIFKNTENESALQNKLETRLKDPGKIKLKIIRNNTNAKKLRRKLAKSFFISADLKSQFDLF